jgi:ribonuclease HII
MTHHSIGSDLEASLARAGYLRLVGVDEAGRGPGAGPVVAAALYFAPGEAIPGVDDSKALSAPRREALELEIRDRALGLGVASVSAATIDRVNIREATKLAMSLAITNCLRSFPETGAPKPDLIIIDGDFVPGAGSGLPEQCFVKGDARSFHIAAASIIAKEWRDRFMKRLAERYPGYGFELHKGYLTKAHRAAIKRLGPCPAHRQSFRIR